MMRGFATFFGKHRIIASETSNIIFAKQMHHFTVGDASLHLASPLFLCYNTPKAVTIMKKVNVLWLIASICWFFWTLINVFELLTDVPFIISVCGTIFIFAAVVVHLVIVIKSIKDKKK
ncbi:MAG: hypothetical protein IKK55_02630 [Clostridia bacterium]|nr:hypothetical protein [Clostridia bacterium]